MPARPAHHPLARAVDRTQEATRDRRIPLRPGSSPAHARGGDATDRPRRSGPTEPSGATVVAAVPCADPAASAWAQPAAGPDWHDQDGSVATEYGLLAVVAATIVSVILEWATGGGITELLAAVMDRVSELVGL